MLRDLMNNPFTAEATEGKHTATLVSSTYKPHANNPANDYIEMRFMIDNAGTTDKIPLRRNMFEKDISIMLSHLRRQLNMANTTIQPIAFLQQLATEKTEFNIWISYPIVATKTGMKRVQNIYFIEPLPDTGEVPTDETETPPMAD